jgi:putative FmdB family regulatory protein
MPTYEFRCPSGHEFERFYRKISDAESVVSCPECGAIAERQLSAGAGLLFKGSGFYLTDYGKNAHRKTGPPGDGKSGEGKSGEGKSGEGKSGEGKGEGGGAGGESKSADAKPSDGSGSKSAEKSTAPPKSSGSGGGDKS